MYALHRCMNIVGPKQVHLRKLLAIVNEPRYDKTNKVSVRPAKTQISLGIRLVWPESSLSAWRKLGSLATHWAHSEDSDQTGRMPRLIWVFAGYTLILLVLSCCGSNMTQWIHIRKVKHRIKTFQNKLSPISISHRRSVKLLKLSYLTCTETATAKEIWNTNKVLQYFLVQCLHKVLARSYWRLVLKGYPYFGQILL